MMMISYIESIIQPFYAPKIILTNDLPQRSGIADTTEPIRTALTQSQNKYSNTLGWVCTVTTEVNTSNGWLKVSCKQKEQESYMPLDQVSYGCKSFLTTMIKEPSAAFTLC
jgi:hypothetical protein